MEEAKSRPGSPGDRSQAAAEKLRALRERASQSLDDHRRRLGQIEAELSQRIQQLTADETAAVAPLQRADDDRDAELATLRRQVEEGHVRHENFSMQLAEARRQLEALRSHPCKSCEDSALQFAAAQDEVGRLREQLDAAEHQRQQDQARYEEVAAQAAAARHSLETLQSSSSDAETQLQADLTAARAEQAAAVERASALERDLEMLSGECESLQARADQSEEHLASASAERVALQQRVAALAIEVDEFALARQGLEAANRDLAAELDEARAAAANDGREQAARLAAAEENAARFQRQLAELEADNATLRSALAESTAAEHEATVALAAAAELQPQLEQAQAELDELQRKFDLALADVQKLKRESNSLREELARRPEASDQESPELVAVRAERDALALRVAEVEIAAAPASDGDARQDLDDLHRRFEMAVDDVRQLKQENAQLRGQLAAASKSAIPAAANGPLDWAAQKAKLLASLEQEDSAGNIESGRRKERASIEGAMAITDRVVAEKEREIAELRAAIATLEGGADDARSQSHDQAVEQILSADELIAAERERLARLQEEWEEKHRAAELEFSVERAKLAREQAALKERLFDLQMATPPSGASADGAENKPRRRWLTALGLGEEGDEPAKK